MSSPGAAASALDEWRDFSLTCVQYPTGDALGHLLAAVSLAPMAIAVAHATVFLLSRDCHTLAFGVGTIANFVFNSILKRVIGQSRPESHFRQAHNHYSVHGMPSSHAQFICFYVTYANLFVYLRLKRIFPVKGQHHHLLEPLAKAAFSLGTLLLAVLVLFGRTYLLYHTPEQVFYGAVIGMACALAWFAINQKIFTPFLYPMGKRLLLHDLTKVEEILFKVDRLAWAEEDGEGQQGGPAEEGVAGDKKTN